LKSLFKSRIGAALLLALALLLIPAPARAFAQENAPNSANPKASSTESMDEPETPSEMEKFRHSSTVQAIGRALHLSTETTARIIEDINSGILIALILWFLFRLIPKAFRKRNDALQKNLLDARLAAAEANERLAVVEERLSKLGIEIEAIRQQTEHDAANDEKRIQESLEAERQRIVASAEQEIEAAASAAQRDLKRFAAELSVNRARQEIRLSLEDDRALIRAFGENLKGERN
jgi:F-type H+-transporting ATPase subunit b